MADVADDADDPALLRARPKHELSDRILPWPQRPRHRFVDQITGSLVGVSLGEMSRPARSGMPIAAA